MASDDNLNISELAKRFLNAVESTGKSKYELSKLVPLFSGPKFTNIKKGANEPSRKMIEALVEFDNNINESWILTGEGQMRNGSYLEKRRAIKLKNQNKEKAVPLFDTVATGSDTETDLSPISHASGTIVVGDLLQDSQAAMRIYGNSMLPNYPSGCVVGLIECDKTFIEPGEVYVLETEDRRLLKRLFYKDDEFASGYFMCVSDNIMKFEGGSRHGKLAYPAFTVPIDKVYRLYLVTGVIKRNANSQVIRR